MGEAARAKVPYDEYLAMERASDVKLEYLDGDVRAMSGGTTEHALLSANASVLLGVALRGRPCNVFSSDLKIRIEASDRGVYADVVVICGTLERSPIDHDAVVNPRVIVEVLSDSTEAYDRGEKFRHYRKLPSLAEYVLVSQREPLVELWRREGEAWRPTEHGPGDVVKLASIDAEVSVDELYARAVEG